MLSARPIIRRWSCRLATRSFSSNNSLTPQDVQKGRNNLEEEKSTVKRKVEAMTKVDPWMVYGETEEDEGPELPENAAEISALDSAHHVDTLTPTGEDRMVHIRQEEWKPGQNPLNAEKRWMVSFLEGDTTAVNNWNNPLMGWVSGSDVMAGNMQLQMSFESAAEAVYFAKKRGWNFIVEEPILRNGRNDEAQYQDCFLPQRFAAKIQKDGKQCDHWKRYAAGASHYNRPLKYHGDGEVPQYGPNGDDKKAPHVESYFKVR